MIIESHKSNPSSVKEDSSSNLTANNTTRISSAEPEIKPITGKWQALPFENSAELLMAVDPVLREKILDAEGKPTRLHRWQLDIHEELCAAKPTSKHPYKYSLCACNGSGKDAYIVTPFVGWFITCKVRALCVLTSSSGVQLSNQTENLIRNYCKKINDFFIETFGEPILHIKQRHIECTLSGSLMYFFATDEEGKAEGYHPIEPGAEMAIIVNEAKSVKPEIFRALKRCTGFNYWLNVSTPGEPFGDFYNSFMHWPHKKRITYYDCPHHSPAEFEEDKKLLGEHNPLFRSKWLALFTPIGGKYVIPAEALERTMARCRIRDIAWLNEGEPKSIGIDIALSGNGDETAIAGFKGNKQTDLYFKREQDATRLSDWIEMTLILKCGVNKTSRNIYADDGGVGRAVIDILNRRGWKINRVLNQSAAKNPKAYRNRGAELWEKVKRFVEEGLLIFIDDPTLINQLGSRKYKEEPGASLDKLTLQNKKEMIAEGLPSPDRADACVLALTAHRLKDYQDRAATSAVPKDTRKKSKEDQIAALEEKLWNSETHRKRKGKHSNYSLGTILGRKQKGESKFYARQ